MVLSQPIPWGQIDAVLYAWVSSVTGLATVWADQDEPRPDYPYLLLDRTVMPREPGGVPEVRQDVDLTRARDVKVTPIAQDSTDYTIDINGTPFLFASGAAATVAEITAGLKSAIDAGSEPVVAVDNGTDLDIEGVPEDANPTIKRLFTIVLDDSYDGEQMSWVNNDTGNEISETAVGRVNFTLNIQAFDRNTRDDNRGSDPDRGPFNQLTIIQSSLGLSSIQAQLRSVRVAIAEEMPVLDISAKVEDSIEHRATLDVQFRTVSELIEYTGFIETVTGTGTFDAAGETITEPFDSRS
jgi:hypothetical protein